MHSQGKRQSTETNPEMTQMLALADKDFEASIITMFNDVKKNMLIMNEKISHLSK